MAEKKKYNSILISGRKDQTLTYSKYVKDEESGESVKESLDKKVNVTDELTTQQIKDGAITNEKMAADSVGNTNLQDGSVSNEKLEDGSITNDKLAENSITKDKLQDKTIGVEKLDNELRQAIAAATGLPENLVETIQNVDDTLKDHQSQLDDKQSQIDDKQQQITANDEDISLLQTRSAQMEETIKSIAATGGASQATAVTYDNTNSQLKAINIQSAVDELQGSKVDKASILQESGDADDKVMSQKAVSDKLRDISNKTNSVIGTIYSQILFPTTYPLSLIETGYYYNDKGQKIQNSEYSVTQAISFKNKYTLYIELPNVGEFGGGALIFENSEGQKIFAITGQDKDTVQLINKNVYAITRRANASQVKLSISGLRGETFSYGYSMNGKVNDVISDETKEKIEQGRLSYQSLSPYIYVSISSPTTYPFSSIETGYYYNSEGEKVQNNEYSVTQAISFQYKDTLYIELPNGGEFGGGALIFENSAGDLLFASNGQDKNTVRLINGNIYAITRKANASQVKLSISGLNGKTISYGYSINGKVNDIISDETKAKIEQGRLSYQLLSPYIYSHISSPSTYPLSSIETGYYYNSEGEKVQNNEYSVTQAISFQYKDTLYIELPNGGEFVDGCLLFENSAGDLLFASTGQNKDTVRLINGNIYAITRRANAVKVKLSISGLRGETFSYGYSMNGKFNDIISDETKAKIEQGRLSYQLLSPYIYSHISSPTTYPSSFIETGYFYNNVGEKVQNREYSVTQAITFKGKDTLYIELPNGGEFGGGALIFENSAGDLLFASNGQDKNTVRLINGNIYAITRKANASQVKLSISGLRGETFSYAYSLEYNLRNVAKKSTYYIKDISCTNTDEIQIGETTYIKSNIKLSALFVFENFNGQIKISKGSNKFYYTDNIVVDAENVAISKNKKPHNLNIRDYLQIDIDVAFDSTAEITLSTNGGEAKFQSDLFYGDGPMFVSAFNGCTIVNANIQFKSLNNILPRFYGDSYSSSDRATSKTRWVAQAFIRGCRFFVNGLSGGKSVDMIEQFYQDIKLCDNPKMVIWGLGMNDSSDSANAPSSNWKNYVDNIINYSKANEIELILCTIPSVPNINHEQKNKYVRNSGLRYIDFAKAVENGKDNTWKSGMLSIDNVHPTELGAIALYMQAISDVPELFEL